MEANTRAAMILLPFPSSYLPMRIYPNAHETEVVFFIGLLEHMC